MRALFVFITPLFLACAPQQHRATLRAPLPSAPFEERLVAYGQLRAGDLVTLLSDKAPSSQFASVEFLVLVDGTIIDNPEDLLPVVSTDSKTATNTAESLRYTQRGKTLSGVSLLLAGISGSTALVATFQESVPLGFAAGTGALVYLVVALSSSISYGRAGVYRGKALKSYNLSLRSSLGICVDEGTKLIYDCFQEKPKTSSGITWNAVSTEVP